MPTSEEHLSWWIVEAALSKAEKSLSKEKRALYEKMILHDILNDVLKEA